MDNLLILAVLAIIVILVIICFILNLVNSSKVNAILDYAEDGDLAGVLNGYFAKLEDMSEALAVRQDDYILDQIARCQKSADVCINKYGAVHFDAFDDVTGKQSFALALLDSQNNGFVLTSIYGHSSCNTYLREIKGGQCSVVLIDEEKAALKKAVTGADSDE